jgi:hypothetical protein
VVDTPAGEDEAAGSTAGALGTLPEALSGADWENADLEATVMKQSTIAAIDVPTRRMNSSVRSLLQ